MSSLLLFAVSMVSLASEVMEIREVASIIKVADEFGSKGLYKEANKEAKKGLELVEDCRGKIKDDSGLMLILATEQEEMEKFEEAFEIRVTILKELYDECNSE